MIELFKPGSMVKAGQGQVRVLSVTIMPNNYVVYCVGWWNSAGAWCENNIPAVEVQACESEKLPIGFRSEGDHRALESKPQKVYVVVSTADAKVFGTYSTEEFAKGKIRTIPTYRRDDCMIVMKELDVD